MVLFVAVLVSQEFQSFLGSAAVQTSSMLAEVESVVALVGLPMVH